MASMAGGVRSRASKLRGHGFLPVAITYSIRVHHLRSANPKPVLERGVSIQGVSAMAVLAGLAVWRYAASSLVRGSVH